MIKKLFSSQLRINMVSGIVMNLLNFLILAATIPICLHYLGAEQYGLWLALSVVLQFAQMGDIGIRQAITKLVAEEYGKADKQAIEGYLSTAIIIVTCVGAVILLFILCFKQQILAMFRFDHESLILANWFLPYIGALSIYLLQVQVCGAALSGLGRIDIYNFIQTASRVVSLVVVATLLWRGLGILSLYFGALAALATVQISSVYAIHRLFSIRLLNIARCRTSHIKKLLNFGAGVFGSSLISMFIAPLTKVLLSRNIGLDAVTVYDIAFRATRQFRALFYSGFRALMPEISRIAALATIESYRQIQRIYKISLLLILGVGLPIAISLVLTSNSLLLLWLGDTIPSGLPAMFRLFLISAFIALIGVPAYQTLLARGFVWRIFTSHTIMTVSYVGCIFVALWTTTLFSINTVGWAFLFGTIITAVYLLWQYHRTIRNSYEALANGSVSSSTGRISHANTSS